MTVRVYKATTPDERELWSYRALTVLNTTKHLKVGMTTWESAYSRDSPKYVCQTQMMTGWTTTRFGCIKNQMDYSGA